MNREQYIKELIAKKGYTIKSFATSIDMPYSTLLSMLNGSIGGAAIDNVMKICKGLEITIFDLQQHLLNSDNHLFIELSEHEKELIIAYRKAPQMHVAIDKLLDIDEQAQQIRIYRAAESANNHSDEIIEISREKLQRLKDAPDTDDTL